MIPSRDRRAFDEFVANSADRLVRTAYLLCGDRGHAEDLVQTALLRTARRWRTARQQPEAYARRVVVNLAKDRWRDLARRPAESPMDGAETAGAVGVIDGLLDRDELLRATAQLPPGPAGRARAAVLRRPLGRGDRGHARVLDRHRQVTDLARPGPPPGRAHPREGERRC